MAQRLAIHRCQYRARFYTRVRSVGLCGGACQYQTAVRRSSCSRLADHAAVHESAYGPFRRSLRRAHSECSHFLRSLPLLNHDNGRYGSAVPKGDVRRRFGYAATAATAARRSPNGRCPKPARFSSASRMRELVRFEKPRRFWRLVIARVDSTKPASFQISGGMRAEMA